MSPGSPTISGSSTSCSITIRANSASGTQVGLAENPKVYVPVIESAKHIEAAKRAFREENAAFLTAVMEGRYTDGYLQREGANQPKLQGPDR
jgi:beta-glucosidase